MNEKMTRKNARGRKKEHYNTRKTEKVKRIKKIT
jgi:hypothetical protein